MRPTRDTDPLLVDTFDALSVAAILTVIALLVVFLPRPDHGPSPAPAPVAKRKAIPTTAPMALMVASWYGPRHAGNRTASGEIFDPSLLTAAHRTLAFGTRLRLSVAGRSCVVTVNDRGPYIQGRDLDISAEAAQQLGMIEAGVAILEARVING